MSLAKQNNIQSSRQPNTIKVEKLESKQSEGVEEEKGQQQERFLARGRRKYRRNVRANVEGPPGISILKDDGQVVAANQAAAEDFDFENMNKQLKKERQNKKAKARIGDLLQDGNYDGQIGIGESGEHRSLTPQAKKDEKLIKDNRKLIKNPFEDVQGKKKEERAQRKKNKNKQQPTLMGQLAPRESAALDDDVTRASIDNNEGAKIPAEKVKKIIYKYSFNNLDDLGGLSFQDLQNHVRQSHPKKSNEENWPLLQSTGSLFIFNDKMTEIPKFMKDIGLGPALYLLTLKSFGFLFMLLSLLQAPVFLLYISGNEIDTAQSSGVGYIFGSINMGNLGESGPRCHMQDLGLAKTDIELKCKSGNLNSIAGIGVNKYNDQQCNKVTLNDTVTIYQDFNGNYSVESGYQLREGAKYLKSFIQMQEDCSTFINDDMLNSQFVKQVTADFEKLCKGKSHCELPHDYNLLPPKCFNEVIRRSKYSAQPALWADYRSGGGQQDVGPQDQQPIDPYLFVIVECDSQEINLIGKFKSAVGKKQVAMILAVLEIITLTVIIAYFNLLTHMQEVFAKKYDAQTVEARDFTAVIRKLPLGFALYRDQTEVKFAIWHEIQEAIDQCVDQELVYERPDSTILGIEVVQQSDRVENESLRKIMRKCDEIELYEIQGTKYQKLGAPELRVKFVDTVIDRKSMELQTMLIAHQELVRRKKANRPKGRGYDDNDSDSESGEEVYEDGLIKKKHINGYYSQIGQVYVTFKSMETKDLMVNLYSMNDQTKKENVVKIKSCRCCLNCVRTARETFFKGISKKVGVSYEDNKGKEWNKVMHQNKLINLWSGEESHRTKGAGERDYNKTSPYQEWIQEYIRMEEEDELIINDTCDPEFINWRNQGLTRKRRCLGAFRSYIIASTVLFLTLQGVYAFNDVRAQTQSDVLPILAQKGLKGLACSTMQISQEEAVYSFTNFIQKKKDQPKENLGRTTVQMYCYCQNEFFLDIRNVVQFKDGGTYCQDWWNEYIWLQALQLLPHIIIQAFNVATCFLYILIARLESQPNLNSQNRSVFVLIFIQHFGSIGILQLLVTEAEYSGLFSSLWFMTSGSSLCLTMIFMIFTMQAADITRLMSDLFLRWWDRSLTCSMKRPNPDYSPAGDIEEATHAGASEERYVPKTKKLCQKDLNELYTGGQIEAGEKFALTYTALTIFIGYSLGLPVLFPLAVVFFLCQYWFNKILLMRYYEKTYEFNEELPIHTSSFGSLGIFINMVMSVLKLSNVSMLPNEVSQEKNFDYPTEIPVENIAARYMSPHILLFVSYSLIVIIMYILDTFGMANFRTKSNNCVKKFVRFVTCQVLRTKKHVQPKVTKIDINAQEISEYEASSEPEIVSPPTVVLAKKKKKGAPPASYNRDDGDNDSGTEQKSKRNKVKLNPRNKEGKLEQFFGNDSDYEGGRRSKRKSPTTKQLEQSEQQGKGDEIDLTELEKQFDDYFDGAPGQNQAPVAKKKGESKRTARNEPPRIQPNTPQAKYRLQETVNQFEDELDQIGVAKTQQESKNNRLSLVKPQKTFLQPKNNSKKSMGNSSVPVAGFKSVQGDNLDSLASINLTEEEASSPELSSKSRRQQQSTYNKHISNVHIGLQKQVIMNQNEIEFVQTGQVVSNNYVSEILLDYLELLYKEVLITEAETGNRLENVEERVKAGKLSAAVGRRFKEYFASITLRKTIFQNQIEEYHRACNKIKQNKSQMTTSKRGINGRKESTAHNPGTDRMLLRPTNSASPASGFGTSEDFDYSKNSSQDYIKMVQYMNRHYDESHLQAQHFGDYFRCKSICQSYHIYHSKDYFLCNFAAVRAQKLCEHYLKPERILAQQKFMKNINKGKYDKNRKAKNKDGDSESSNNSMPNSDVSASSEKD